MDERESASASGIEIPFFKDVDDLLLLRRDEVLRKEEGSDQTSYESASEEFLKTIASDGNIAGVVFSEIRRHSRMYWFPDLHATVVVKELYGEQMHTTQRTVIRAFEILGKATGNPHPPHLYTVIKESAPSDYIKKFKEEFHKSCEDREDPDNFGVLKIAGSSKGLKWIGAVMFE